MILRYSLLSFGLIAFGTVIGVILVNGPRGAWDWLLDSLEAARGFTARKAMPADGMHRTGGQARLPDLPDATPESWTPLLDGTVDDVRREHGRHERTVPRITERTIDVTRAPGHAPWSGSFTALQDPDADARSDDETADEIRRAAFARSQLGQHDPADITPQVLEEVLAGLRAMPVQEARERFACCVHCLGSTVPCEPPDMHLASCADCDAPVYGEAPQLEVERLERLMRP